MRLRETVERWDIPSPRLFNQHTYTLYNRSTGAFVLNEGTPYAMQRVKSIEDVSTPNFKALQKCGEFLPPNPTTIITKSVYALPGYVEIYRDSNPNIGKGFLWVGNTKPDYHGNNWWDPHWEELDQARLDSVELAAAAKAVGQRWDVLTSLAEMRETLGTIAILGKRLNNTVAKIYRTQREVRRNPWKFFQGEWLQARYGIRPIVYDIASAIDTYYNWALEVQWVKGRAQEVENSTKLISSVSKSGPLSSEWTVERRMLMQRTYRSAAYVGVEGSRLNRRLQLDLAVTAYELIPLSFVLDQFIDFGAYVQTLGPQLRMEYLGRQISVRDDVSFEERWHSPTMSRPGGVYFDPSRPLPGYEYDYAQAEFEGLGKLSSPSPNSSGVLVQRYQRWPVAGPLPLPSVSLPTDWMFHLDLLAIFVKGKGDVHRLARRRG